LFVANKVSGFDTPMLYVNIYIPWIAQGGNIIVGRRTQRALELIGEGESPTYDRTDDGGADRTGSNTAVETSELASEAGGCGH